MHAMAQDIRFAVRTLRRNAGYTIAALLTLILGIGANTAVFSVVYGVLLAPLPYPESHRIVRAFEVNGPGNEMGSAWVNYLDWRDRATSFEALAAHGNGGTSTVLGVDRPLRVPVTPVSKGFFAALGVEPARGRAFLDEEHALGADPAVIVSDAFWHTQLGASPDFAEQTLTVGAYTARIVGVMPPGFDYPAGTDLWYPLELSAQSESRSAHNWSVTGRLRPGIDLARAEAELDAITRTFLDDDPGVVNETWFEDFFPRGARVHTLRDALVGATERTLWILLGASVLVLLVAATNLASATLARGANREREYAVRRSLGAGRARIIRQLFTESLVLSTGGAVLGIAAAALALRLLPVLAPSGIPRIESVRLDLPVLGVTLIVAVMTAVLFGLLPALRLTESRSAEALRSGGRGGEARGRNRVWQGLIAIETALALTLLVGSGLLIRSLLSVLSVQPGFTTTNILTATVNPPASRYGDDTTKRNYFAALQRELESVTGAEAVGLISAAPMSGISNGGVAVRGSSAGVEAVTGYYQVVTPDYFAAMGIPLLRGRNFDDRDHENAPHTVLVNRAFAELAWPGEDPIGKQMTGGGMDNFWDQDVWATVIGVVADIRQRSLEREPDPTYYFNLRQRPFRSWSMTAAIRPARGEAVALTSAVRAAIGRVDRDVPVSFSTIDARISGALVPRRFTMLILAVFGLTALALACVGIWGVVSYAAARRTREIGIRMALGADPRRARRLVQREYLRAAGAGGFAGLALTIALSRVLRSLLYEIEPTDPTTVIAVLAVLAAATWLASYVPSLRSSRVSPMEAMRTE